MTDRWGRPTVYDGLTAMRGFMDIQDFQRKQKKMNDEALVDKYFGAKIKGEEVSQTDPGYSAKAELSADELVNKRWQVKQTGELQKAEQKLTQMQPQQVLSYQPASYAEHVVASDLIKNIREDTTNRQEIENLNKQKALESYHHSNIAFNEAREMFDHGDYKGASDALVKIGMITNNPFKVKPSEDGKTVELYWTKDGVDQPGQQMPIDQAMQVAQQHLSSDEFFQAHLQNREARRKLNEESVLNPVVLEKGGKQLRAIRELDLNTNQVRWSVYDDQGNPYGQQLSDLGSLAKQGWTRYDSKQAKEELGVVKTAAEIEKIRQQTLESKAKTENVKKGGTTPKSWKQDWWPKTPEESEGGGSIITDARAIVARAYDTYDADTKELIINRVFPKFKQLVEENKDQPVDSQTLQKIFDEAVVYEIQNAQGGETAAPAKEPSRKPMKKAEPEQKEKPVEAKEPEVEKAAKAEEPEEPEYFLGKDENIYKKVNGQPVRVMRKPPERIYNNRYPNPEWARYQEIIKKIKAKGA